MSSLIESHSAYLSGASLLYSILTPLYLEDLSSHLNVVNKQQRPPLNHAHVFLKRIQVGVSSFE